MLEGTQFTDGCASVFRALRRAAWALVASDTGEKLILLAYGLVAANLLPSLRDGDDCAAAVTGPLASDSVTLLIDCVGGGNKGTPPEDFTIKQQTYTHPEQQVKEHATDCVSHTGFLSFVQQAARWAGEAHVILRHRGWRDTMDLERAPQRCKKVKRFTTAPANAKEPLSRHGWIFRRLLQGLVQLTLTERSGRSEIVGGTRPANCCGRRKWENGVQDQLLLHVAVREAWPPVPGGRSAQLRKLRSGSLDNLRRATTYSPRGRFGCHTTRFVQSRSGSEILGPQPQSAGGWRWRKTSQLGEATKFPA